MKYLDVIRRKICYYVREKSKRVNECEGGRLHYEMLQYTIV